MRSIDPISRVLTIVAWLFSGLACLLSAGMTLASQADESRADELQMLSRYEAALAEGDQTAAVRYVLDYAEETFGENDPATVKLTHRY
jgi:hypothetical protein